MKPVMKPRSYNAKNVALPFIDENFSPSPPTCPDGMVKMPMERNNDIGVADDCRTLLGYGTEGQASLLDCESPDLQIVVHTVCFEALQRSAALLFRTIGMHAMTVRLLIAAVTATLKNVILDVTVIIMVVALMKISHSLASFGCALRAQYIPFDFMWNFLWAAIPACLGFGAGVGIGARTPVRSFVLLAM
jgi:hypothetical protein